MNFNDYKYERIDIGKEIQKLENAASLIKNAKSFPEFEDAFNQYNSDVFLETMTTLCSIRHSINTNDEFYSKENDFLNESLPQLEPAMITFLEAITTTKFRLEAEKKYGKYLFKLFDLELQSKDKALVSLLTEEYKLVNEYNVLIASAKLEFDKKIYNLSQMRKFSEDKDRSVRKRAREVISKFFLENEEKFDTIFDKLIKNRTNQAKIKGYDNFVKLGYDRLQRTDYSDKDVFLYREAIKKYVVPIAEDIIKKQAKRVKISDFKSYDVPLFYLDGNAKPKGTSQELVEIAKKMYNELSKETGAFFEFMTERGLMDLESKPGKQAGGYCTYISNYKSPFIFANFNQTEGDVTVLTHEAGHAFQVYTSRNIPFKNLIWPTLEACEIHSMSMEFLTWPWMKFFFKEDTDKFLYSHLAGALTFLPYGALIDEFQHFVYLNPDVSPKARREKFRELEKIYMPYLDHDHNLFYESGGRFFQQGHVFSVPFYYIDYTLAQVCAFQFLVNSTKDRDKTWKTYLKLCSLGGTKPFLHLLESVDLLNPMAGDNLKKILDDVKVILSQLEKNI